MEEFKKFLNLLTSIAKYFDKKSAPLILVYGTLFYYLPIALNQKGQVVYTMEIIGGVLIFTLIYCWLFLFRSKGNSDELEVDSMVYFYNKDLHRMRDEDSLKLTYQDKDKGECVKIFMLSMIDGIEIACKSLVNDRNYDSVEKRLIAVKDYIQESCKIRNVPFCIYSSIHAVNFSKIYHFYQVTDFVGRPETPLKDNTKLAITMDSIYNLYHTILKTAFDNIDKINGDFKTQSTALKDAGSPLIIIINNSDIYSGLDVSGRERLELARNKMMKT